MLLVAQFISSNAEQPVYIIDTTQLPAALRSTVEAAAPYGEIFPAWSDVQLMMNAWTRTLPCTVEGVITVISD